MSFLKFWTYSIPIHPLAYLQSSIWHFQWIVTMLNVKGRLTFQPFNKTFSPYFPYLSKNLRMSVIVHENGKWLAKKIFNWGTKSQTWQVFASLSSFRIGWSIWNLEGGIWRRENALRYFWQQKRIVFERHISMHNFAGNFQAEMTDFRESSKLQREGEFPHVWHSLLCILIWLMLLPACMV